MEDDVVTQGALVDRARLQRMLMKALCTLTPSNWYESVETCKLLDEAKALLTQRQRRALLAHLTHTE